MYFSSVIDLPKQIHKYISSDGLPGESAHKHLIPGNRPSAKHIQQDGNIKAKRSAVLILLYPKAGEWHNVLIKRPVYPGTHSGQVSFPGGKVEKQDPTTSATALREANEEIGVEIQDITIIDELTDIYIPPSNFLVHPYLACIDYTPDFIPDNHEVASIIEYEVMNLTDPNLLKKKDITFANGFTMNTPYFDIHEHTVWGATGIMLSELKEILKAF